MKISRYILILIFIIIVGLVINLVPVLYGIFPITYDQGRDFLWVKNQIDFHQPTLIGPAGSMQGVYFGPLWFWLLSLPYILFNGSPIAMTLFNALIVYASLILTFWVIKKYDFRVAYFFIFLGFISPAIHSQASYAFSQHLLPLLTAFFIYSLTMILKSSNRWQFILAWFWVSLMFHAEPPVSIFSIPALIIISVMAQRRQKFLNLKTIVLALVAFIIPFLPLLLFDFRHDFIQLRSVVSFLGGDTRGLQEIAPLTLWQRLLDRQEKLFFSFKEVIFNKLGPVFFGVLIILARLFQQSKLKPIWKSFMQASLIYLISFLLIFTLYPHELKLFYLAGIQIIFLIWLALGLSIFWQNPIRKKIIIVFLSLLALYNLKPFAFIKSWSQNFSGQRYLGSLYINQLAAIDWIYQDAAGKGFKVYTFAPPIYDYSIQYLIFWRGLNRYGYLPEEFSYQPDQPEYVVQKNRQLQRLSDKIKLSENLIYFLITPGSPDQRSRWYYGLKDLPISLLEEYVLPDDTKVEKYSLL